MGEVVSETDHTNGRDGRDETRRRTTNQSYERNSAGWERRRETRTGQCARDVIVVRIQPPAAELCIQKRKKERKDERKGRMGVGGIVWGCMYEREEGEGSLRALFVILP